MKDEDQNAHSYLPHVGQTCVSGLAALPEPLKFSRYWNTDEIDTAD